MTLWPLNKLPRVLYWALIFACMLFSVYCFLWAIQTAWTGSFPGRDIVHYTRMFYLQLGASALGIVLAVVVGIKGRRVPQ